MLEDWQRAGVTQLPPGEPIDLSGVDLSALAAAADDSPAEPALTGRAAASSSSIADRPMPRPKSASKPRTKSGAQSAAKSGAKSGSKAGQPPQPAPSAAAAGESAATLAILAEQVAECTRCPELAAARNQTVFGTGDPNASILLLGEAPGADEDKTGEPFVGRAGKLLTDIIHACGWTREELYICNVLRCRPPGNRNPTTEEAANCRGWLDGQIAAVQPDWIICWGSVAAKELLATKKPIGKLRRQLFEHEFATAGEGTHTARVLCTYHPSYLLRNPAAKKDVWDDLKYLMAEMAS